MEVLGLEHVDLTVNDLERSTAFYSCVLEALGFERFEHPGQRVSWSSRTMSITIRPATAEHAGAPFDRYHVGLHHLALKPKARTEGEDPRLRWEPDAWQETRRAVLPSRVADTLGRAAKARSRRLPADRCRVW